MNGEVLLQKIEEGLTPVLADLGYELVEREFAGGGGNTLLRLYIDHSGEGHATPVSIADCERVSRAVEPILDVESWIPGHYTLEVSSPGLDRPLRRPKDFERFQGNRISLKTKQPIAGRSHFIGLLKGLQGESVWMEIDGLEYKIPLDLLKKANVKYGHP